MFASRDSSALAHRIADLAQFSSIDGVSPARVYLVRAGVWSADPQLSLPLAVGWVPHRLLERTLPSGATERFKARLEAAGRMCTVRPSPFIPVLVNG